VLTAACLLVGCGSGSSSGASSAASSNQGFTFFGLFRNDNKPAPELTVAEGTKLLKDIRKDPGRLETLSPQEKRFVAKAVLAGEKDEDE
jgi:hypothetical protein